MLNGTVPLDHARVGDMSLEAVTVVIWDVPGTRPSRRALSPMRLRLVAAVWWSSAGQVQVLALVWLTLLLLPCAQQRPLQAGAETTANASCARKDTILAASTVASVESDIVVLGAALWLATGMPRWKSAVAEVTDVTCRLLSIFHVLGRPKNVELWDQANTNPDKLRLKVPWRQ